MIDIHEVITSPCALANRYIVRDGFVFTSITHPANVFDTIVMKDPSDAPCFSSGIIASSYSLQEQIDFINAHKLEKAFIIAENIDFITNCPTLKHLRIIPPDDCGNNFDYSPLYSMPQIKSIQCATVYGRKEAFCTQIDCAAINGLESIHITNDGYKNYNTVETLKSLGLTDYKKRDLSEAFNSSLLDTLSIFQSKTETLEGIQKSPKLQCLYLHYNRSLRDISALKKVKNTLRALRIDHCPKIEDFSVLQELENLELLELTGENVLPDLHFLKNMKNLKTFTFSVNVADGDLSPCLDLSYVYAEKNRKHYNLKNKDLPKVQYVRGNENIELWRRLE